MKKLMIAVAAVAMGIAASAATVDWRYQVTAAAGGEGYNSGYTVYLFDSTTWAAQVAAGLSDETWTKALDSSTMKYAAGRNPGEGTYTVYKGGSTTTTGNRAKDLADSVLAVGATLDATYVILNDNKDPSEYFTQTATLTGRLSTGQPITTGYGTITAANFAAADWKPTQDVPEPTSGLLLVLGVAGLALKRKRA